MGVKSPSTVMGRANSMLSFLRWHTVNLPAEPFLPLRESHAWEYVSFLSSSKAPASRASAFIQSCRFAHFVLGMRGADEIFKSGKDSRLVRHPAVPEGRDEAGQAVDSV